jgi:hypothetical protein
MGEEKAFILVVVKWSAIIASTVGFGWATLAYLACNVAGGL